jgi:hypothetical protein
MAATLRRMMITAIVLLLFASVAFAHAPLPPSPGYGNAGERNLH